MTSLLPQCLCSLSSLYSSVCLCRRFEENTGLIIRYNKSMCIIRLSIDQHITPGCISIGWLVSLSAGGRGAKDAHGGGEKEGSDLSLPGDAVRHPVSDGAAQRKKCQPATGEHWARWETEEAVWTVQTAGGGECAVCELFIISLPVECVLTHSCLFTLSTWVWGRPSNLSPCVTLIST